MFYMADDEKAFDGDTSMMWSYIAEAFLTLSHRKYSPNGALE